MTGQQLDLFDSENRFHLLDKKIRLISLFSGYDAGVLALKYLGVPFEHYKTCEWAIPSIKALYDLHFNDSKHQQLSLITDFNDLCSFYAQKISKDYCKPLTEQEVKKISLEELKEIDFAVNNSNNLLNICYIHGADLEIVDKDKYNYLLTYSFPCQDLSKMGTTAGLSEGSNTRSSLLWEVGRLLDELKDLDALPQMLLMENVPQVLEEKHIKDFAKWISKLESLGYKNYEKILNALDYGVPQNRERCYMVSLLGDYTYYFPKPFKTEKKLKDYLETDVPEKYFYSSTPKEIRPFGNYITWPDKQGHINTQNCRACVPYNIALTIPTEPIVNVIVNSKNKRLINTVKKIDINNKEPQYLDCYNCLIRDDAWTITTRVDESNEDFIFTDYRVRKLTPRECFRLMGVKDEDYNKIAPRQTDRALYHMAGDSIVVDVLMPIFKEVL